MPPLYINRHFVLIFTLATATLLQAASADPGLPDYFPTCNSPQPSAPQQAVAGSSTNSRSNPVWNGQEFGVAYVDSSANRLKFVRVYADGKPASTPVTLTSRTTYPTSPSLVWNGAGYGVSWSEYNPAIAYYQIYFARLNPDGTMIGTELQVSFAGGTVGTAFATYSALAWSGAGYAVVWIDYRNSATTGDDIYGTLLDATGAIAGGGFSHDLVVSNGASVQGSPTVAWSGYGAYVAVWHDYRSAIKYELWGAQLRIDGTVVQTGSLVSGVNNSVNPSLAETGNGLGLVWSDYRDGNYEIYFARLRPDGTKVGGDVRLTNDIAGSVFPRIVWTGGEFGVVWRDTRPDTDTWFQRVSQGGVAVGGNTQVTYSGYTDFPDLAFGRYGYLLTGTYNASPVILQAWGCTSYLSPPSCPGNLLAYNITGTSATLSWLASDDFYYDIAYYKIYRNNLFVGQTSNLYFTDTGLPLSSSSSYAVRAVNAAQFLSPTNCPTIYVKTNASLTLTMNKATASDAGLNWTDAGFNSYNLWRGTRPQVMTQIGATPALASIDANVLTNSNSYFYSVDNPGP